MSKNLVLTPLKEEYPSIVPQVNSVVTIGRSESCDFTINNQFLSFVHASLIAKEDELFITDLDSTNGVFVNEKQIKAEKIKQGDLIRFASVRYKVELISLASTIDEKSEVTNILRDVSFVKALSEVEAGGLPNAPSGYTKDTSEATSVIDAGNLQELRAKKEYTLVDIFPQFEFSEFIFEENIEGESLDFNKRQACVELSVLFGSFIYGVYYFNHDEKNLVISNKYSERSPYVFPIVGLDSKLKLIEAVGSNGFNIIKNDFFSCKVFNQEGVTERPYNFEGIYTLKKDDVAILSKDSLQIFLRITDSPPKTKKVGFFDRDKFLFWLFLASMILWLGISALLFTFEPPEKEVDPNLSQKIDRILYKKKEKPIPEEEPEVKPIEEELKQESEIVEEKKEQVDVIKGIEDSSTLEAGAPVEEVAEKEDSVPEETQAPKPQPVVVPPPPPASAESEKVNDVTELKDVSENVVKISESAKAEAKAANSVKKLNNKFSKFLNNIKSNTPGKSQNTKYKKSITQTGNKKGTKSLSFMKNKKAKSSALKASQIGDFGSKKITTGGVGNLVGFSNSMGKRTVVLGALDPRDIQNALKEHLPRFSFCYEQELERINKRLSTTLLLKFTITPSGGVKKYSFTSKNTTFSSKAIRCFSKVLTTIKFPKPKGGGIVKVNQPISMEPRY